MDQNSPQQVQQIIPMTQPGNIQQSVDQSTSIPQVQAGSTPSVIPAVQVQSVPQPNNNVQIQQINQQSISVPQNVVGGTAKEFGPIMNNSQLNQELIRPTDQEPMLAPEIKEVGVAAVPNPEHIQVKPELKSAGLEPIKTAISVTVPSTDDVQLPMSEEAAETIIKTHPAVDSVRWLATLIIEQAKKLHRKLR